MKTLKKDDFLIILKNIVNILDKNNIAYQIPLCHLDKKKFNYIDIIISKSVDIKTILKEIQCRIIKNDKNRCSIEFEDFQINFILVLDSEILFNYHFYSWNIFPFLITALSRGIYLDYDVAGLKYKNMIISRNMKKNMDFLGIDFKKIFGIIIPKLQDIYSVILNSEFFSPQFFNHDIFKEIDPNYVLNKNYYDEFMNMVERCGENCNKINETDILFLVNSVFPDCKIYEKAAKSYTDKQ